MLDTKALVAALAPVIKDVVKDAVSAAEAPLLRRIEALESRAPEKGEPGQDGKNGSDGKDAPHVTEEQIEAAVKRYLTANPPADGKDGSDGKDGADGAKGEPGENGIDGKDGVDGVGVAGAVIDRDGVLNLTLSNGEVKALGRIEGRDGKDGERGEAGFSLDDFETDWRPDEKLLVLSFTRGDMTYSHELFVPYVRDAGVWAEGKSYTKGDSVTWGGSSWIAQEDTNEKPEAGKAWRLAVKRGRDGKDFAGPPPKALEKVKI